MVGVFVNEAPERVAAIAGELGLAAVQLHGEEGPDTVRELRGRLPAGCELWKAIRVSDRVPPVSETGADRLLCDVYHPRRRGGTGERFDWRLLGGHPERGEVILAGGLSPENAGEADEVGAWALDVNSGVEEGPGRKCERRLAALFDRLRGGGR